MQHIVEETVIYLFGELEREGTPIVVMRNYQQLPDVGNDLDAAIRKEDIGKVREILQSEYIKSRWTEICEVKTHNSTIDEHNIFVFKFFNTELNEYMQIDFFQGFLFKGQPFFSVSDFLSNKRAFNSFPVVSANVEMTIKYFQIYNAIHAKQWQRVEKYTLQAKNLISETDNRLQQLDFEQLNNLLSSKSFDKYTKILNNYRNEILVKLFRNQPISFIFNILKRIGSFYSFYVVDPFIVNCSFALNTDKELLQKALNDLVDKNCFRYFYFSEDVGLLKRMKEYMKMATGGGVIVSFSKNGKFVDNLIDSKKYIVNEFVAKHTRI